MPSGEKAICRRAHGFRHGDAQHPAAGQREIGILRCLAGGGIADKQRLVLQSRSAAGQRFGRPGRCRCREHIISP